MITFFTCPKPFIGSAKIIQRNAVKSWKKSFPFAEIMLFGKEAGMEEAAKEFGANCVDVKKNEYGRPFLDDAFNTVQRLAKNNILIYANCDIILTKDILETVKKINFPLYLLTGRRYDLEVKEEINFENQSWEKELREKIAEQGKLHGYSGMDYFIFPKNFSHNLLSFPVGIVGWDNWLVYNTKKQGIPVIDATEMILAVHQNHDYFISPFANEKKGRVEGPEMERSIKLAGGFSNMMSIRESDWILTKKGLKKSPLSRRFLYLFRVFLGLKRKILNS